MLRYVSFVSVVSHAVNTVRTARRFARNGPQRLAKRFLNGDPRAPMLQHVENGCCSSRAEMVTNVVSAIAESGLILGLSSELPVKNRWGSCDLLSVSACSGCSDQSGLVGLRVIRMSAGPSVTFRA